MSAVPLSDEPTNAEKIRRLPWSVASNTANTVFVQYTFFGSAFILFLNQLELNNSQIGFLLSLFPFFGIVAIFIAPIVARFGYKRTYVLFYGARKVVSAFLLFIPWVLVRFGSQATLITIMVIVILFALCRSISETALYPWIQEYVPNSVRGRYAAANDVFSRLTGVVAAAVGAYIIGRSAGLNRFIILIAIGVIFGFISVWAAAHRPGGAARKEAAGERATLSDLLPVTRDKNFVGYLLGLGLVTLATVPMVSFLPLFMEKQVGLSTSAVVWLQTGSLVGGLASTFLWGWAADRYGSKPVMLSSIFPKLLLPIGWLLMPQNSPLSLAAALGIALVQGFSEVGWAIGSSRLLFVSVVPPAKKTEYMAVYYAAIGLIGGFSQLIGGWILDATVDLNGSFLFISLNPYVPLFLIGLLFPLLSLLIMRRVQADSPMSTSKFAGMFLQGHPFLALGTLPRYYLARDERTAVAVTERLGQTKSPLTVEELLDALTDARFNVRFEAIISIARMPTDPRLVRALQELLSGTELSLSVIAAWALGRIGDEHALESLRAGLNSEYHSIRAHCARALGALNDQHIIPLLLERLENETDIGLQMAYASTLGNLRAEKATQPLLELLETVHNAGARRELALSLARIIGNEQNFITLLRQVRGDMGTTISQNVTTLARKARKNHPDKHELHTVLQACAAAFARQQLEEGVILLSKAIRLWPDTAVQAPTHIILHTCADQLDALGTTHEEYILLALHTLAA